MMSTTLSEYSLTVGHSAIIRKPPPPEQRLMVLETLHEVDALLGSLPDRVRQAFLLAQIEGLKYEAIAERLGVSLGSVKRYMQQAFRQCLELME